MPYHRTIQLSSTTTQLHTPLTFTHTQAKAKKWPLPSPHTHTQSPFSPPPPKKKKELSVEGSCMLKYNRIGSQMTQASASLEDRDKGNLRRMKRS